MIEISESADIGIGDGVLLLFAQFGIMLTGLYIVAKLLGVGHLAVPKLLTPKQNTAKSGVKYPQSAGAMQPPVPWVPEGTILL